MPACLSFVTCALIVAGCGRSFELGDLRVRLPGPDRDWSGSSAEVGGGDRTAVNEAALDQLVKRLEDPGHEPSGEVVLQLSLTGGWGLPAQDELHLSIEDDGRVVMVTDTSVFSSVEDFTSLRLSPAGVVRVLDSVRPLLGARREDLDGGAGVSPTDRSAWLEVGTGITLSMDRLGRTEGYDDRQQAARAAFASVIAGLRDLGWLGADIEAAETPWVPGSMTVLATRLGPSGPGAASAPWPLDRAIEDLAIGTDVGPSGDERLVLCLAGANVAPVFGLLTGMNHAHLAVHDGASWELDVRPHYPGYRLLSDPCP